MTDQNVKLYIDYMFLAFFALTNIGLLMFLVGVAKMLYDDWKSK